MSSSVILHPVNYLLIIVILSFRLIKGIYITNIRLKVKNKKKALDISRGYFESKVYFICAKIKFSQP